MAALLDLRTVLRVATPDAADAVEIKIHDNGTGILPEIRDKRCAARFFNTIGQIQPLDRGREVAAKGRTRFRGGPVNVGFRVCSLSANIPVVGG